MDKAIITAASDKFFPSLINLLGSIRVNYPGHPKIYIYDLGLFWLFRKELESLQNVEVLDMPHFCPFWRSCYTWKAYILSHPLAGLNFYLDAGCQVLRPLDIIFQLIEERDFFTVGQGTPLEDITPREYAGLFRVAERFYGQQCITAGIFGYKAGPKILPSLAAYYNSALSGLCLGFSPDERHRNKGADKTFFVRDCKLFRHDTTTLTLQLRQDFGDFPINDNFKYGGAYSPHDHPEQVIWNLRRNYSNLKYVDSVILHDAFNLAAAANRVILRFMLFLKRRNLSVKKFFNKKGLY